MPTLRGIHAAVLTPRRVDSSLIDLASYWELIDFLGSKGLSGLVLMGSTGEFVHFPLEERTKYLGLTVKRSRLPILVNVTHSTLDGSLEIADAAARGGAAGILLMPPYFFRYSQDELRLWFEQFAREKPQIPAYLYNIPSFSNALHPSTAASLLESGRYQGIKDSSGDWDFFTTVRDRIAGRESSFLVGNDALILKARMAGASGAVSGVACAMPELLVALHQAIEAGDQDRASKLNARLHEFLERIDLLPTPMGIRIALAARKLRAGPHSMPVDERPFASWFLPWLEQVLPECRAT